jgi:coenzyme F420-reducing hydrogenase gamma subunit
MKQKRVVGFFAFGGCTGCQHEVLNLEEVLLQMLGKVEISFFPLIKEQKNEDGPFDIAFVEGAIVSREDIARIRKVRANSKFLISLGTCATFGGIPSVKNFLKKEYVKEIVYKMSASVNPVPVSSHVKVDFAIKGCPIDKHDFLGIFKELLAGKKPTPYDKPVCVECRANNFECLLQKGADCLGPITCGGCNAVCTGNKIACYGCRGPTSDANIESEVKLLKKKGYSPESIRKKIELFAGLAKKV